MTTRQRSDVQRMERLRQAARMVLLHLPADAADREIVLAMVRTKILEERDEDFRPADEAGRKQIRLVYVG